MPWKGLKGRWKGRGFYLEISRYRNNQMVGADYTLKHQKVRGGAEGRAAFNKCLEDKNRFCLSGLKT